MRLAADRNPNELRALFGKTLPALLPPVSGNKLAVDFHARHSPLFGGLFWAVVVSQIFYFPAGPDNREPALAIFNPLIELNAFEARFVIVFKSIHDILGVRSLAQIANAIVEFVVVDMVDIKIVEPFAMNPKPREAMREDLLAVYFEHPIAGRHMETSSRFKAPFPPAGSHEDSRLRVIIEHLTRLLCRDRLGSGFHFTSPRRISRAAAGRNSP